MKIVVPVTSEKLAAKPRPPVSPAAPPVNIFDQDEFEKWLNDPTAAAPDDVSTLPEATPVDD